MLHTVMTDPAELAAIAAELEKATRPEDIFGELVGSTEEQLVQARRIYRRLAVLSHPDTTDGDKELAARAFDRLNVFWERVQKQIAAGVYGTPRGAAIGLRITGKRHRYSLEHLLAVGEVSDVYECVIDDKESGIFKLARKPTSAALLQTEARNLRQLNREVGEEYAAYFPSLLESVRVRSKGGIQRIANSFSTVADLYSIEEVVTTYRLMGKAIEPKDMAWIWRRLLTALGATHDQGLVHGAVLPAHVLVQAEQHGVVLVGWGTSLQKGETQRIVSRARRDWYPPEVFAHKPVSAETDIAMAAKTMLYLLGSTNPAAGVSPRSMPTQLRAFFKACTLPKQNMRPDDAWALKETFDDLIERLWGPRRFRSFYMPKR